ncbi:hypothetical protein RN607_07935 [Demequina capsici]|uniref:Tetratricopeptide repeat-containing protein n=1 Tax=Demequina capsici TaxID=3075620 RepID=A0AA96JBV5_9MICO|nr:hypothetical protein [Demequina sp. PMTSA13]WNM26131.1 hypothetical protein RN607_07935 [Demequina sp. PMTSA13]
MRERLRTLSKDNAEDVGRHLVMAGRLLDFDPETAYKHAQIAAQRAGRVDVVREAAALTAYATGRYAEALRELRTVRRLNGSNEHLPLMADCERGLGRPERALDVAREDGAKALTPEAKVELEIVVAGARMDLGEGEAALVHLGRLTPVDEAQRLRIVGARAEVLRSLGRAEEAAALEAEIPEVEEPTDPFRDDVILYDTAELWVDDDVDDDPEDASEERGDALEQGVPWPHDLDVEDAPADEDSAPLSDGGDEEDK